jgi:cobalt-zinc-cadmium efflux system protein
MSDSHHDHEHCDHPLPNGIKPDRIFKIGISLNLAFVVVEIYYGYLIDSLALISDAFHNLTDVFALLIGWLGYELTRRSQAQKYSLWAALFNSSVLLLGSIWVVWEALLRLKNPELPVASTMIIVSSLGFVINFISAKLFHKDHHHDLNMKSAHLHLMADAAISLGVAVAGVIIYFYSLDWVDPVFSIVISVIIVYGAGQIILESLRRLKS